MQSLAMKLSAALGAAAMVALGGLATPACSGGESCFQVPACKFVDLLAGCVAATGCATTGPVTVHAGSDNPDPSGVQLLHFVEPTTASMNPNSTVSVTLDDDAATLAEVPLLDISVDFTSSEATPVSVLVDGQPFTACAPTVTLSGTTQTAEWKCPLPSGTKTVEVSVVDATATLTSLVLTEPTCTGSARECAL